MMKENKKSQTLPEQRPMVCLNGVIQQMDDEQYADYLRMQAELEHMPPPLPPLEEQISVLQAKVDDLTLLLADMIGDGSTV